MTFFHFINCALLTFGPHAVYYKATPLSEYDTLSTSIKAGFVYIFTALIKLICLATFLQAAETEHFDLYQEFLKAAIALLDLVGIYYALTQLTHRSISQSHRFQAVGLGWAFADALLRRMLPLWFGARGQEFTWKYLLEGVEANSNLIITVSLASLSALAWLRKNKPPALVPLIYLTAIVLTSMPSFRSYLKKGAGWELSNLVAFETAATISMAAVTWRLYTGCQGRSS